jgi:hypothetical protein
MAMLEAQHAVCSCHTFREHASAQLTYGCNQRLHKQPEADTSRLARGLLLLLPLPLLTPSGVSSGLRRSPSMMSLCGQFKQYG